MSDVILPTIISVPSKSELSQRQIEEYSRYCKVINAGRKNPVWFNEYIFGYKLMDYQKWMFMESWSKPYVLWLCSRAAGKTTLAAMFLMDRMLLIPNYNVYISTNSSAQSIEVFKKIEDLALQKIPSFASANEVFSNELQHGSSETGFYHNPAGHKFTLYNDSELLTLSTNLTAIRGKRGAVFYDECAWQSTEQMAATEHFADLDKNFKLGTEEISYIDPPELPLQLLYASSAGDVGFPFYNKYCQFSKKMFLGDPRYFVCDINANTVVNYTTVDGKKIKSHLTQESIDKSIDEDPELADRELFNKFRKGAGQNAIVKAETLIKNSYVRKPLFYNDTGKKKFIFCYDPARNFDGSALSVWELIDDKEVGYRVSLVNMVSMVDTMTKNKTPLPMPDQLRIIKQLMLDYNGDRAAEWENIEFYIDAGSGGGGISAVADQLMEDWTDDEGRVHRGIIDPVHKQYETARLKYPNAMPIVHLIDPAGYKKIMYGELEKNLKLNLMDFPEYDGKDFIMLPSKDKAGEFDSYELSERERICLLNVNLLKNEMLYMCRYQSPNGTVMYELSPDRRNKMHDDRA